MRISIIVKFQFEGIHNWPLCDVPGVEFLKYPHRHIFHVTAEKEVTHGDRDIEIINLKREFQEFIKKAFPDGNLGSLSCEQIAQLLVDLFNLSSCEVLEDGENGARVTAL